MSPITVPRDVLSTLRSLAEVFGTPPLLVGGWAAHLRLLIAHASARPTEDLDVLVGRDLRPTRAALAAIGGVQRDPQHRARLEGLPLMVDLLADDADEALKLEPGLVTDEDGLELIVPPFADLLAASAGEIALRDGVEGGVTVMVPAAGALFACKVGNLYLEHRGPEKRPFDAMDALTLLEAYGAVSIDEDLMFAEPGRRRLLAARLEQLGYSALLAQTMMAGGHGWPEGPEAVTLLIDALRAERSDGSG